MGSFVVRLYLVVLVGVVAACGSDEVDETNRPGSSETTGSDESTGQTDSDVTTADQSNSSNNDGFTTTGSENDDNNEQADSNNPCDAIQCDPLTECTNVDGVGKCSRCPDGHNDVNRDGTICERIASCTQDSCESWAASSGFHQGVCLGDLGCEVMVESSKVESCDSVCASKGLHCGAGNPGYYWIAGYPRYGGSCDIMVSSNLFDCAQVPPEMIECAGPGQETGELSSVECRCYDRIREPPPLNIYVGFPTNGAVLGGASDFTVTGWLEDPNDGLVFPEEVIAVRVNGVEAVVDPQNPSQWRARISIPLVNHKLVATVHSSTGSNSAELVVDNRPTTVSDASAGSGPAFSGPTSIVFAARFTETLVIEEMSAYVTDIDKAELFSIDLSDKGNGIGHRTILSGNGVGRGPNLVAPISVALALVNPEKAFVIDADAAALLSVDIIDQGNGVGHRSIISNGTTGTGPKFLEPFEVVLSADSKTAFVADNGLVALLSVDLVDRGNGVGHRAVISSASVGGGPIFSSTESLAISMDSSTAYVIDENLSTLFSVDLVDNGNGIGFRTIISNGVTGGGPEFSTDTESIAVGPDGTTVLVADDDNSALLSVDLVDKGNGLGFRRVVSDASTGNGLPLSAPWVPAIAGNEVLVTDPDSAAVFLVDLLSGDRALLSK